MTCWKAAIGSVDNIFRLRSPMTLLCIIISVARVHRFVVKFDLGTELTIAGFDKWLSKIDVLVADIILVDVLEMALSIVTA